MSNSGKFTGVGTVGCVIGGSGFIGTRLIDQLLKSNINARIFDKNPSAAFTDLVTVGDVRDLAALDNALSGVDVIYNLAAEHRDDVTPASLYFDVNVQGARNIVSAAEKNNVRKIVFTSTVAVYGLNKPNPDESFPTEPFNDYGKSKLQAEEVFNQWAASDSGRSLTIVRPVVIFGEKNRGNVYNLIKQIEGNRFVMVGLGENAKSMGYVGNITSFLAQCADFGPGVHLFNYADKPDMKVKDLVRHIRDEWGMQDKNLIKLPYALGLCGGYVFDLAAKLTNRKLPVSSIRIRKFCANTTVSVKALEDIGFSRPYTIEEGLKRMIAEIKNARGADKDWVSGEGGPV